MRRRRKHRAAEADRAETISAELVPTAEPEPTTEPVPTDEPAITADSEPTAEPVEPADSAEPFSAVVPTTTDELDRPHEPRTPEPVVEAERPTALRMARLHLRTGSLALARVELETLAGDGTLDEDALLDLAEVRWRTDDLTGAGEAAAAHIASGREAPIALIIAAEATAALGRPGEARRLAGRAIELVDGPIDAVFAGMPRSEVWPVQSAERVAGWTLPPVTVSVVADERGRDRAGARVTGDPQPDPGADLDAARAALAAGDRSAAAFRLSVVLRLSPTLAPAVLDIAGSEVGPDFDLVRGDALRLVGREVQAREAFAAAAAGRRAMDRDASRSAGDYAVSGADESADQVSEADDHAGALADDLPDDDPSGVI